MSPLNTKWGMLSATAGMKTKLITSQESWTKSVLSAGRNPGCNESFDSRGMNSENSSRFPRHLLIGGACAVKGAA